jgi:hypothetical protein
VQDFGIHGRKIAPNGHEQLGIRHPSRWVWSVRFPPASVCLKGKAARDVRREARLLSVDSGRRHSGPRAIVERSAKAVPGSLWC